jgi:hypothetical protein
MRDGLSKVTVKVDRSEEPPAARNRSSELTAAAPLPSVTDHKGPHVSAARGRESVRAARARHGPRRSRAGPVSN